MIEAVTATNGPEFRQYAHTWGPHHDESFVPSAELPFAPDQPALSSMTAMAASPVPRRCW